MMRTSDRGVAQLAYHEGIVTRPYLDSVGVWTVGIGHTASAGNPDPRKMPRDKDQPMDRIIEIFRSDLRKYEREVNDAARVPLEQHEFDALVSFHFNTGGIRRARLTRLLNEGDYPGAAEAFLGWLKPPGIERRRRAEMRLFRDGVYDGDGRATVYPANSDGRVLWSKGRKVDVLSLMREPDDDVPSEVHAPADPDPPSGGFFSALMALIRRLFS